MVKSRSVSLSANALEMALTSIALWAMNPEPERLPTIFSFVQFPGPSPIGDSGRLLVELLDGLIALAHLARPLSEALGGEGDRPERAAALIASLMAVRRSGRSGE